MSLHSFTHIALRAERLREAETFYRELFALEVAFREAEMPDGWRTLPPSADWDDAERSDVALGLVMLYGGGLRLALEAVDAVAPDGILDHIGVWVDEEELERLHAKAAALDCRVVVNRAQALILEDPYGIRWELNSFPYEDPPAMSTGARTGRWIEIRRGG
jgi:catechol 2,3-dioxygenase-like lactoylglutathione lyase family enzyme